MPREPWKQLPFHALPERPRKPHPYFDVPARHVAVDSSAFGRINIHVREWGKGPPLLLVHGLMTTSYSFRYVLDPLGAHYRVIVPDLPGCGRSDKPDVASYDPRSLSSFLGELQTALGIEGCACVGNSLGGYLCMVRALSHPASFSKLVNIHSPALPIRRLVALSAALAVPGAMQAARWWMRRAPLEWAHKNVHYRDESLKSLEEAREYGGPLATEEGSRAFFRYLDETLAPKGFRDFTRRLTKRRDSGEPFPIPLLMVYAREDPMVPPSVGEAMRALVPSARFEWLEQSSHFAHVDSPEKLVPLILDFLTARRAETA